MTWGSFQNLEFMRRTAENMLKPRRIVLLSAMNQPSKQCERKLTNFRSGNAQPQPNL
jgi:hypothetical protein